MASFQQVISVAVCASLVASSLGMDGCKKEVETSKDQAPAATYAAPTADQLYQLVAPVALFPDKLLAQVLAASTYPDQVADASTWLQQNSGAKGAQLTQAVDQQSWDVSVKGLTQFPDVMQQMAGNLSWTSALGDAYYNAPQNVMNAVQVMRQRAYQAGNLKSSPQQNVNVETAAPAAEPAPASSGEEQRVTVVQSPPQVIVIEPSQPDVVYVPSYNPTYVYGAPVPVYPGYSTGAMVTTGLISFGVGMMMGAAMSGGCCGWGWNSWGCGWNNSSVSYNNNVYVSNSNTFANRTNINGGNRYNGGNRNQVNPNARNDLGNRGGAGDRNGVGGRDGVGGRNGVGDRNGVGGRNGAGDRNGAGGRNGVGDRNGAGNRGGDFGNGPRFDNNRNQPQFKDQGAGNRNQGAGDRNQGIGDRNQGAGNRSQGPGNSAQQRPANQPGRGGQAGQPRANDRQAVRGYGDRSSARSNSNNALGNSNPGGNARANSARGQQSLSGNRGSSGSSNAGARSGGGAGRSGGGGGSRGGSGGGSGGRSGGGRR
jgi:hypothetical protein